MRTPHFFRMRALRIGLIARDRNVRSMIGLSVSVMIGFEAISGCNIGATVVLQFLFTYASTAVMPNMCSARRPMSDAFRRARI